jgi:hypothetical protein
MTSNVISIAHRFRAKPAPTSSKDKDAAATIKVLLATLVAVMLLSVPRPCRRAAGSRGT